jgi:hypothetical protein
MLGLRSGGGGHCSRCWRERSGGTNLSELIVDDHFEANVIIVGTLPAIWVDQLRLERISKCDPALPIMPWRL